MAQDTGGHRVVACQRTVAARWVAAAGCIPTTTVGLRVEREAVASAPPFPDPHVGPDEEYQRTIREHYGYG
jgi:hypothetical protein